MDIVYQIVKIPMIVQMDLFVLTENVKNHAMKIVTVQIATIV